MAKAKAGDRVKVHFVGTLNDETVFGRTHEEEPFEFTIGEKTVLPDFENAVIGMNEGDTKTISIPPELAYGHRNEELVHIADRSEIPSHIVPEPGKRVRVGLPSGELAIFTVTEVSEDKVIFDANDPLAGRELTFEIELLEILGGKKNRG